MNLIYHPDLDTSFNDFGILIPLVDDRSQRVFNFLKKHLPTLDYLDLSLLKPIFKEDLLRVHDKEFVDRLYDSTTCEKELLKTYELIDAEGRPYRYRPQQAKKHLSEMMDSILKQVSGTLLTCEQALQNGFSYFLGGGMHHAMTFAGRGFCPVHDIAISIRHLQQRDLVKNVWVLDVDAHKGDGTAEIFQHDESVRTLSIHMQEGWPLDSDKFDVDGNLNPWFIESDVEIGIRAGEESLYLEKLEQGLFSIEKLGRPDLVIVVDGADPYEADELPSTQSLRLTKEQMLLRDLMIYKFLSDRKIPQAYVMAGGYGKSSWEIYSQFLLTVLTAREEELVSKV